MPSASAPQTETRQIDGHPFFIRRWGAPENPPLLMLHGFPEYGGAWADLAPLLAHRFHCIAPDQRGYGQSWAPDDVARYDAAELARDMAGLIDQFGGRALVLGHDWGSAVAYMLAMRHADRVSRLIIANGVHPLPFQRAVAAGGAQTEASQYIHALRREGSEDRLAADDYAGLMRAFSAKMDLSWMTPERLKGYKAAWNAGGGRLKTMIHWYRASRLQVPPSGQAIAGLTPPPRAPFMVHCPHLLIWGEGDTALLPEATEGLEDFAPDLTRVTVPGTDHWLCHQKPEEIARIILDWTAERGVA